MQLISILLIIVGILSFLSGAIVLFGSNRSDRATSIWYFLTAFFATLWLASVAFFCISRTEDMNVIPIYFHVALISAMLLDAGFLGYAAWSKKSGKILTIFFILAALVVGAFTVLDSDHLYSDIILSPSGNGVKFIIGPLLISYFVYFAAIVPCIIYHLFNQFRHARSKRKRVGGIFVMVLYGVSSLIVLITNLIMPLLGNWSMFWLGPLSLSTIIISIYYMVLRYKAINLSYIWLRIFSYIVVVASIAIVYMIIFSIIFAALFRGSTPSIAVIALNFIMLLIFISLIPAMNGFIRTISRLTLEQHPHHAAHLAEKSAKNTDKKEKNSRT